MLDYPSWIGVTRHYEDNYFNYASDGSNLTFSAWDDTEPIDIPGYDCVVVQATDTRPWASINCSTEDFIQPLCEKIPQQAENYTESEIADSWLLIMYDTGMAELRNWKTLEHCTIFDGFTTSLLFDSLATVMDGTPAYYRKPYFYSLNLQNLTSTQISKVNDTSLSFNFDSHSLVPNVGWFFYGGMYEQEYQTYILTSKSFQFIPGPATYERNSGVCLTQLNETLTAIIGGFRFPKDIVVYNWVTKSYTKQKSKLLNNRAQSMCTTLIAPDGTPVVAVLGSDNIEDQVI